MEFAETVVFEFLQEQRPHHREQRRGCVPVGVLVVVGDVTEVELADEFDRLGVVLKDIVGLLLQPSATGRSPLIVGHGHAPPVLPLVSIRLAVRLTATTPNSRLELRLLLDTGESAPFFR